MTKYVICERSLHHAHAGSKARDDIRRLLEQEAWQPFEVHPGENQRVLRQAAMRRLHHSRLETIGACCPVG